MGIYVWGTGCGASELIDRGLAPEWIAAFVESRPDSAVFLGRPVLPPEAVPVAQCDLMIVTTRHVEPIAEKCADLGIPAERRLYLKNSVSLSDRNANSRDTAYQLLGKELAEKLLTHHHIVPVPGQLRDTILPEQENDYVRMGTLELLCRRLDGVPGAAAELGVYRGQLAQCVNRLLSDRTLYLFDSFQGFDQAAGAGEAIQAAHEKTSAEQVLAVMPNPERVVLKPGFFPESLEGLEETFCFVSLDVDFEPATLAGLRYFWPRLSSGGYLMLHDWGNPFLPGPALALERYQAELGKRFPAVPIPDLNGTLVLCKI